MRDINEIIGSAIFAGRWNYRSIRKVAAGLAMRTTFFRGKSAGPLFGGKSGSPAVHLPAIAFIDNSGEEGNRQTRVVTLENVSC